MNVEAWRWGGSVRNEKDAQGGRDQGTIKVFTNSTRGGIPQTPHHPPEIAEDKSTKMDATITRHTDPRPTSPGRSQSATWQSWHRSPCPGWNPLGGLFQPRRSNVNLSSSSSSAWVFQARARFTRAFSTNCAYSDHLCIALLLALPRSQNTLPDTGVSFV